jgi:hypothetical protein
MLRRLFIERYIGKKREKKLLIHGIELDLNLLRREILSSAIT